MTRLDRVQRSSPVHDRLSATLAWGHNREIHGNLDGYLLEWDWRATPGGAVYGRGEVVDKDILTLGSLHPRGIIHFHQISRVAAAHHRLRQECLEHGLGTGRGWR